MSEPAIEIQDLHKSYGHGWLSGQASEAVNGVHLNIQRGETWALAGPNGAGKTTTLHCLLGLLAPDSGTVRVYGRNPLDSEARRPMAFQSEVFFSYPYLTAKEALQFYGKLSGLRGKDLESRVERSLDWLQLSTVENQRLSAFSKGMMQRLGLAQSLLHDPDLIVWDEPSTGLDPEGRRLVADLVTQFKSEGKTVLLSTHILSDIERVCDHIAILDRGKLLVSAAMESLMQEHPGKTLEDIYLSTVKGASFVI